jgi:hypothetical protein
MGRRKMFYRYNKKKRDFIFEQIKNIFIKLNEIKFIGCLLLCIYICFF